MASINKEDLYVGMAKDLKVRISEHKDGPVVDLQKKIKLKILSIYEQCDCKESAVLREKQLKKWNKSWKIRLIEKFNPEWKDLYSELN